MSMPLQHDEDDVRTGAVRVLLVEACGDAARCAAAERRACEARERARCMADMRLTGDGDTTKVAVRFRRGRRTEPVTTAEKMKKAHSQK